MPKAIVNILYLVIIVTNLKKNNFSMRHTFAYRRLPFDVQTIRKKLAFKWLGGSVVRALDTRPKGPRFSAQPMHY